MTDSSPLATSTTNTKKPFYRGKTFAQWLKSAELDRDYGTQSAALEACAATMETDQERASLLKLTAKLARKHGSIVTGLDTASDRYNSAFMSVLEACDADQIFDFIKTEISDGTLESRHFCAAWLILFNVDSLSAAVIRRERKKISRVQNRFNELTGLLVENVNKPGVILLIRYLIPSDSNETYRKQVKEFRNSAVGIKVKEFILKGTPQQRFSVLNMAFEYFVDDPGVFEAFERDLLDPSINDVYVELTGKSKSWPVVRAETFQKLLSTLAVSGRTKELMKISDINNANRLKSGARILMKVTEGIMSEGDKRLLFAPNWYEDGGGGIGMSELPLTTTVGATEMMLQSYYNIALADDSKKVTQSLLPSLEKLKASLDQQLSSDEKVNNERTLNDLDYLIAYFKGSPTAKLPNNTLLRDANNRLGGGLGGGVF